ncbi:FlgD immunoglobulin-like domain containing protein [Aurantibacter sp.]|uniref:FlgD immunoglobulin-like domain containing protein n=1 Tax=Aurantibacter sp. TaxID=2807103 RepID=UPI00326332E5
MRYLFFFLLCSSQLISQNYHYAVDTPDTAAEENSFTYTLAEAATTSAGIYTTEGILLRTLWSNEYKTAGSHAAKWDGLDDEGVAVTKGTYSAKVLANNVQYEWEGAKIGNTSKHLTGENRYHGLSGFFKFIVVDDDIYWTNGYNEQRTAANQSSIHDPQVTTPVLDKGAVIKYVCADENYVFWSGHDVYSDTSFVFVTTREENEEYQFSKASNYEVTYGRIHNSTLNTLQGKDSYITGLARSGNYLFIARQLQNTIHVLDITTGGTLVQTIKSINAPRELTADGNGNLWIISNTNQVAKYQISANGMLGSPTQILLGIEEPLTLGFNKNNNQIAICDGGTRQQVRFFNATNGAEANAFGQLGGYANIPAVANDKFYFSDSKTKNFDGGIYSPLYNHAAISFQNDGSFWVLDVGNNRMMHYGQNRNFIETIQYTPDWLMMSIDKNNSSRLFVDFLEYEIDYSEEDVAKTWKLKNNWGFTIKDEYNNAFGKIREPVTLSNGRTYFLLAEGLNFVVAELSENGIRITDKVLDGFYWVWLDDGTLVYANPAELGKSVIWEKYELIGFDANNDPIFSNGSILAQLQNIKKDDPLHRHAGWFSTFLMDNDKLVSFDGRPEENGMGGGYHLGLLDIRTNEWLFKTSKATGSEYDGDYPLDGGFDTGNDVHNAGSKAMVFGDNILWGYYGEFWKGGFQTNQYAHYNKNGLLLNVFGTNQSLNPNHPWDNVKKHIPFEGMAGNVLSPFAVAHPNNENIGFLYHPDESWHGGIHRWKISELKSVVELELLVILN